MNPVEIKVPDIGDFKNVDVAEVLVKPGDLVRFDDNVIVLEPGKVALDIQSPHAGRVVEVGPPSQIFDAPTEERTRAFMSKIIRH